MVWRFHDRTHPGGIAIKKVQNGVYCEVMGTRYLMTARSFTLAQYSEKTAAILIKMDEDKDSINGIGYEIPLEDLKKMVECVQKIIQDIEAGEGEEENEARNK